MYWSDIKTVNKIRKDVIGLEIKAYGSSYAGVYSGKLDLDEKEIAEDYVQSNADAQPLQRDVDFDVSSGGRIGSVSMSDLKQERCSAVQKNRLVKEGEDASAFATRILDPTHDYSLDSEHKDSAKRVLAWMNLANKHDRAGLDQDAKDNDPIYVCLDELAEKYDCDKSIQKAGGVSSWLEDQDKESLYNVRQMAVARIVRERSEVAASKERLGELLVTMRSEVEVLNNYLDSLFSLETSETSNLREMIDGLWAMEGREVLILREQLKVSLSEERFKKLICNHPSIHSLKEESEALSLKEKLEIVLLKENALTLVLKGELKKALSDRLKVYEGMLCGTKFFLIRAVFILLDEVWQWFKMRVNTDTYFPIVIDLPFIKGLQDRD